MAEDDLAALIGRVALKDRAAFSSLYAGTSPKLFGICLRILKNREEAEEAAGDLRQGLATLAPLRDRACQSHVEQNSTSPLSETFSK